MHSLEAGVEGGTILDYKIIRIILRYMKLFGKLVIFVEGWGGIVRVFKCFAIMIMFQCLLFQNYIRKINIPF